MSTTHDLASTGLAKATGVSSQFANLWTVLFAENAAIHPIEQGETDDQWVTRLAAETSADMQAICETHLTDRDAFRRLADTLAMAAKAEFGHRHTRKPWSEISSGAKDLIEMKQAREGDTE